MVPAQRRGRRDCVAASVISSITGYQSDAARGAETATHKYYFEWPNGSRRRFLGRYPRGSELFILVDRNAFEHDRATPNCQCPSCGMYV
jgi:hypothetical protein